MNPAPPALEAARLTGIDNAGPYRLLMPSVHNREVISPRTADRHSPFILMVEDQIGNVGEFGVHAHRGFITVTILLEGKLEHVESCDDMKPDVLNAGDVQWMTAGRGIRHGGRPVGDQPVHALQLWLNLLAALKMTPAVSRVQRSTDAACLGSDGVSVTLYAGRWGKSVRSPQSPWPMTLMDIELGPEKTLTIDLAASERGFLYVLEGEAVIEDAPKQFLRAGQVAWFGPYSSADSTITVTGGASCRAIYGAALPIDEPMSAGAGFVMNTADEIEQAYQDLATGKF